MRCAPRADFARAKKAADGGADGGEEQNVVRRTQVEVLAKLHDQGGSDCEPALDGFMLGGAPHARQNAFQLQAVAVPG